MGQPSKLDRATTLVEARTALVTLGYKKHEAAAAVAAAQAHVGGDAPLDHAGLAECPIVAYRSVASVGSWASSVHRWLDR
ncbi:MAG: hypothetical protein H0T89_24025 [Deltaproteobacteria bacterium]|nr:hypothetical protein [Deltaproteobacteria bacterium]